MAGRAAGTPNKDKAELRALLQERVHEFTMLRRKADIDDLVAQGLSPAEAAEKAQEIIEDYDPVVNLALVSVDRRVSLENRIKCNAEVAQYVRPKLKSIEVRGDAATAEDLAMRQRLANSIILMMEDLEARAKGSEG